MTDEQPTPPPLDLEAIQQDWHNRHGWTAGRDDVDALVAEVRRLRANVARFHQALSAESQAHAEERARLRADLAAARAALADVRAAMTDPLHPANMPVSGGWTRGQQKHIDLIDAALGDRP